MNDKELDNLDALYKVLGIGNICGIQCPNCNIDIDLTNDIDKVIKNTLAEVEKKVDERIENCKEIIESADKVIKQKEEWIERYTRGEIEDKELPEGGFKAFFENYNDIDTCKITIQEYRGIRDELSSLNQELQKMKEKK